MNKTTSDLEQKKNTETVSHEDDVNVLHYMDSLSSSEEKLRESINRMRIALSREKNPDFRAFWIIRKCCLPLFSDISSSSVRALLWKEYIELTKEGRRLKSLMDEETSFAIDQIDLAISSLEKDVELFSTDEQEFYACNAKENFVSESIFLRDSLDYYQKRHPTLIWLNAFVSRIINLRKELTKIDMRIRFRNRFFQRLSALGDMVFPKRKTLIKEVSDFFSQDVKRFIQTYFENQDFSEERNHKKISFLRSEIKLLQNTAKVLVVHSQVFSNTRHLLSECWDQLKGLEKDLKKKKSVHRKISLENVQKVQERIQDLNSKIENDQISLETAFSEVSSISSWMRELDLVYQDVLILKGALKEIVNSLNFKKQEEENLRKKMEEEQEIQRKIKVNDLKKILENFELKISDENVRELFLELEEIKKEILSANFLLKSERLFFEKAFKNFKEKIVEKQEAALLLLSEDDKATLENLNQVLIQRKTRRKDLKIQIEEYRKIMGGSGFDFEKAMYYDSLIQMEKEKLAAMDASIKDLEGKIIELKQKVT